jgi:hypothetical protein
MKLSNKAGVALVGVLAVAALPAQAATVYRQQVSGASLAALLSPASTAGASFGSPLAFGASWGDAGAGVFVQTLDDSEDGAAGLVLGLGNANEAIGLEASVALSSLLDNANAPGGFGDNGSFSLKLHTALPGGAAFAVGVNTIGRFGNANDADRSSLYAVGTKVLPVSVGSSSKNLVLNLGVGDNGFAEPGKDGVNIFGSAAFYFCQQISVIADYTGRFTNLGISVAPFKKYPFSITAGAINVGDRYDAGTEFAVSAGYGLKF